MKPFSADTDPAAHAVYIGLLRQATVARRLELVQRMNDAADTMALARLRDQYPDDTPREQRLRLQALKYDDDLLRAAFGWVPEDRGR